jgi:hypothetical protein
MDCLRELLITGHSLARRSPENSKPGVAAGAGKEVTKNHGVVTITSSMYQPD